MAKLTDRVHAIIRAHPDGISSPDICSKLDSDKPHARCMVAHVLTQLYRAKKVDREHLVSNSAKTYLYKAAMTSVDFIKEMIRNNPGISSFKIREQFATCRQQSGDVASTILTNLTSAGKVTRKKLKKNGKVGFCYFINATAVGAPASVTSSAEAVQAAPDIASQAEPAPFTLPTLDQFADGLELAAQVCELQAKMFPGDVLYAAICGDCAKRIRQFVGA